MGMVLGRENEKFRISGGKKKLQDWRMGAGESEREKRKII
jgi:hypothetical protein